MHGIAEPIAIFVRMLAVTFLVAGTYNPSGYSYWHWAIRADSTDWALKVFFGFLIIFGFTYCVSALWRSMGLLLGLPLILVIGTGLWLLSDWGWIDFSNWLDRTLALEASLAIVLGMGVSFSLIRYRLSGQLNSRTLT